MYIKKTLLIILFGFSVLYSFGQQIGNYIGNGSFEQFTNCNNNVLSDARYWNYVDSIYGSCCIYSGCNGLVPGTGVTSFQYPKTGQNYSGMTFFMKCATSGQPINCRWYFKNRLLARLDSGKTYCAKFFVNIENTSSVGTDGFGMFFGDGSIDTITKQNIPLNYYNPQIKCIPGNCVTDTLAWTPITGTFVSTGKEKYAIIDIFSNDQNLTIVNIDTTIGPGEWTDALIDDVSCVEVNLAAYAGPNKLIYSGDSTYIGRQSDWAIDPGCIWYKLPNMTTAIDTISGLWVKPTATSTYVVRQELDCSAVKWDTVVVTINTNLVSVNKLQKFAGGLRLFPNPTSSNLKIIYSGPTDFDPTSFSIFNALGQNICEHDVYGLPMDLQTVDFPSGLYMVHFRTSYGTVTKKFVKTD